jgi:hypothetical protein
LGGLDVLSFRDQVRILAELLDREIDLREPTRAQAARQLGGHVPAPFVEAVLDYWAQSALGSCDQQSPQQHPSVGMSVRNVGGVSLANPANVCGHRTSP